MFNIPNRSIFFNSYTFIDNDYETFETSLFLTDYYQAKRTGWLSIGATVTSNDGFIQVDIACLTIREGTAGALCQLLVPVREGQYFKFLYTDIKSRYWAKLMHTNYNSAYIKY